MISSEKELMNRENAGYQAMENSDWRLAYDCFNDCLEYLKYYEAWREDDIAKFQKLVTHCREMFW